MASGLGFHPCGYQDEHIDGNNCWAYGYTAKSRGMSPRYFTNTIE